MSQLNLVQPMNTPTTMSEFARPSKEEICFQDNFKKSEKEKKTRNS